MNTRIIPTIFLTAALFFTLPPTVSRAGDNGADGFLLGAGGGAIMGQAIGRDTEGTLLGTAIGGVLGYIIGNEMDKEGTPVAEYRSAPRYRQAEWPPERRHMRRHEGWRHDRDDEWRDWDEWNNSWRKPDPECRETEILAYVDGRPETVIATSCLERGEWVLVRQRPATVSRTVIIDTRAGSHFHRTDWRDRDRHPRHWRR